MNTRNHPTFSTTDDAGVPPAPPEAHQRADVSPITCKARHRRSIKEWIEEAFVKFAFKLLSAADSGCHSIVANEYAAGHPLGEDVRRPIQSWCEGFLDGWRQKK